METGTARIGPGAAAGITEEMIDAVVRAFYGRLRRDAILGPIFERVVEDAWDAHLAKMCDFWSAVLLMSRRFDGTPMATHIRVGGLEPDHFASWLRIFGETAVEVCPPAAAALFVSKAEMIARSLQLGIAGHRGELPPLAARAARPPT